MTAPIDIDCPACASTPGNYCTAPTTNPSIQQRVTFHHAERVDAAFRAGVNARSDARALRFALNEALLRLERYRPFLQDGIDDESFVSRTREAFGL